MKRYDLLLADADGTVLDFEAAEDKALRSVCEAMGLPIDDVQADTYKRINAELWRALERGEVTQEALRTLRFARFLEHLGIERDAGDMAVRFTNALGLQTDEIEGAHDFLEQASRRVPVVIVTNGIASVQRSRFGLSPLAAFISGHVISGEQGFAKPDPRMIEAGLAAGALAAGHPVPKERALMLGDALSADIAAANAAGVDSVWYNPGGETNDTSYQPTYEVRTLAEVLQWL